jgi:hypothetical protein
MKTRTQEAAQQVRDAVIKNHSGSVKDGVTIRISYADWVDLTTILRQVAAGELYGSNRVQQ